MKPRFQDRIPREVAGLGIPNLSIFLKKGKKFHVDPEAPKNITGVGLPDLFNECIERVT